MRDEIIFIIEDSLDGGFEASAVGHSNFTEAENLASLKENIREAVACHFYGEQDKKQVKLLFQ